MTRAEDSADFEPAPPAPRPSPTVGEAARRNWALILVVAILFGGLGVAAGLQRDPVYTSSATLSVGRTDLTVQSIPGFGVGGASVAGSLSRSVRGQAIVVPAARKLGVSPAEVARHIFATSIPQSTLFTIGATGDSPRAAITYANAASAAMVAYGRGDGSERAAQLLKRYQEVTADLSRAKSRLARMLRSAQAADTAAIGAIGTTAPETSEGSSPAAIARLRADIAVLELRQETRASRYRNIESESQLGPVVQRVTPALGATSDRNEKLQLLGGIGVLAGLFVGLALAVFRTALRHRRLRA